MPTFAITASRRSEPPERKQEQSLFHAAKSLFPSAVLHSDVGLDSHNVSGRDYDEGDEADRRSGARLPNTESMKGHYEPRLPPRTSARQAEANATGSGLGAVSSPQPSHRGGRRRLVTPRGVPQELRG
nr:hypothetical protein Iba_chr10dCG11150 [Ipomoea batatas]